MLFFTTKFQERNSTRCPGGGIGRRARFRCVFRKECRFKSCSGHQREDQTVFFFYSCNVSFYIEFVNMYQFSQFYSLLYFAKTSFSSFLHHFQYKNPNIQRGSFAPSGISQSSANTKESSTPAICVKSLLRPPISKVYFASTLKSP